MRPGTKGPDELFTKIIELTRNTTIDNTFLKLNSEDLKVFDRVFQGIANNAKQPDGSILKSVAFAFALGHEWAINYRSLWPLPPTSGTPS